MKTHHAVGIHPITEQKHLNTRGHQAHLDISDHLDPNTTIKVDFEVSTDHGETWQYGGGLTCIGGRVDDNGERVSGQQLDKDGKPMRHCVMVFGHEPSPEQKPAATRLVRGTIEVIGNPVATELTFVGLPTASVDKSLIPK